MNSDNQADHPPEYLYLQITAADGNFSAKISRELAEDALQAQSISGDEFDTWIYDNLRRIERLASEKLQVQLAHDPETERTVLLGSSDLDALNRPY